MSTFDLTDIARLLPPFLGRQRWFAGDAPTHLVIEEDEQLHERLLWLLVNADDARYQVLVASCDEGEVPDFLTGHDSELLGASGGALLYDATLDPELNHTLLARVAPGESANHVRPMGAEQSNTSIVFDDRLVLKVFRRIYDGANPDIEVTAALGDAGFAHVAAPIGVWERDGRHLAVAQPFLVGATDGWALALTSLRDFYGSDEIDDPAQCGGDMAAESRRLGEVSAEMHVALSESFGSTPADVGNWVGVMLRQLERVAAERDWSSKAAKLFEAYAAQSHGPAIRVHGDYHLGQVVRTDAGWFVLDFEGEPARPLDERRAPSSSVKDVAGMLRSFHYASMVAVREREEAEDDRLLPKAAAWEERNRKAFLAGYLSVDAVAALLPEGQDAIDRAIEVWELDKAVYEVGYEQGHRPSWVTIPEAAVRRILEDR